MKERVVCFHIRQSDYSRICFDYIHQNPVNSNLVKNVEDWEFSSFRDFAGLRNGTLVNRKLVAGLFKLDLPKFHENLIEFTEDDIKEIF